mmetsp:Transcript_44266/g.105389  ORF Transcript_44266/g.105389 Transcript_44266/m.105389 type:complete len:361 (-) Transcript_44266:148-1230(-)
MTLRGRALRVQGVGQLVVAVQVLHLDAVAQEPLGAVHLVHIRAGRHGDALEQLLIGLPVLHDAQEALPGLLLRLALGSLPGPVGLAHVDVASIHRALGRRGGRQGGLRLHLADGLVLEALVAEAADVALVGQLGDLRNLRLEGFGRELAQVVVLHPVHREQVTQARTDILALHHGRITTIRSPRRLVCVRGRNCKDLAVRLQVWEHGAALTGFHVEDHLLEHLLALHGLQRLGELFDREHWTVGEGDDAGTAMVHEVHEHGVTGSTLQHLALCTLGVSGQDVHEQLSSHNVPRVVDFAALVNIRRVLPRLVEQLAGERVLLAVRHVVLHHQDDVVCWYSTLQHELVGMASIRLVAVVHES